MTTTETLSPEQAFKKYQEKFMAIPDEKVEEAVDEIKDGGRFLFEGTDR